jgi:Fic family protein
MPRNRADNRIHRQQQIVDALLDHQDENSGALTRRRDVARISGLSAGTVRRYVEELLDSGVLTETYEVVGGQGDWVLKLRE